MIRLENIHKAFDGRDVLRGVNLTIAQGRSLAIIGQSGSGKSVLLKSILGLMTVDRGTISYHGRKVDAPLQATLIKDCGMLFQGAALFDSLLVWKNVAFRALQRGMPQPDAHALAIDKLARVGLPRDVAKQYPAELSGGMAKRVGLARAIADDPKILFFDEPTTGLDPIMARKINTLIRGIVDEMAATAITITHDMSSVAAIADDVAFLDAGQLAWTGDKQALQTATLPKLRAFIDA